MLTRFFATHENRMAMVDLFFLLVQLVLVLSLVKWFVNFSAYWNKKRD